MAYSKTTWENLPSTNTPLNATNLNKIETELDKLDPSTAYTQATGKYTTAEWTTGTNTCTWTAPRTGLYIVWMYYNLVDDSKAKVYHQLQMQGTASRANGSVMLYQVGVTSSSSTENNYKGIASFEGSKLVSAQQGQTVIPYVHCPEAGIEWNVSITGLFLK